MGVIELLLNEFCVFWLYVRELQERLRFLLDQLYSMRTHVACFIDRLIIFSQNNKRRELLFFVVGFNKCLVIGMRNYEMNKRHKKNHAWLYRWSFY